MNDATEPDKPPEGIDLLLLANFVHQVVNPLNGVAGTLDNLAEGRIKQASRQEQRLAAARGQIEQCITLMRNLAFLVQGEGADERKIVVLPQVIIEAAQFFQEDGKTKKIEINLDDRVTQNRVTGNRDLIKQVLMNIFDNCVKYGKRNSIVHVSQWIQSGTNMAIITVRGVSERPLDRDELPSIFNRGFRGRNAKKIVASGTGLGLFICKQIVEKNHGGSLTAQVEGSDGILFTVKLPDGQRG